MDMFGLLGSDSLQLAEELAKYRTRRRQQPIVTSRDQDLGHFDLLERLWASLQLDVEKSAPIQRQGRGWCMTAMALLFAQLTSTRRVAFSESRIYLSHPSIQPFNHRLVQSGAKQATSTLPILPNPLLDHALCNSLSDVALGPEPTDLPGSPAPGPMKRAASSDVVELGCSKGKRRRTEAQKAASSNAKRPRTYDIQTSQRSDSSQKMFITSQRHLIPHAHFPTLEAEAVEDMFEQICDRRSKTQPFVVRAPRRTGEGKQVGGPEALGARIGDWAKQKITRLSAWWGSRGVTVDGDYGSKEPISVTARAHDAHFRQTFVSDSEPTNPWNSLRLLISSEPFGIDVSAPRFIQKADMCVQYGRELSGTTTTVAFSDRGAFAEFHVDSCGCSTFLWLVAGCKDVYLLPPDEQRTRHLLLGRAHAPPRNPVKNIEGMSRIKLLQGQGIFIPGGWSHAVYTRSPSVFVMYDFYYPANIASQLSVWNMTRFAVLTNEEVDDAFSLLHYEWAKRLIASRRSRDRPAIQAASLTAAATSTKPRPFPDVSDLPTLLALGTMLERERGEIARLSQKLKGSSRIEIEDVLAVVEGLRKLVASWDE